MFLQRVFLIYCFQCLLVLSRQDSDQSSSLSKLLNMKSCRHSKLNETCWQGSMRITFKWWLFFIISNTWNSCGMALMWMVNSSCQGQHPVTLPGKRTHHRRTLLSFPQMSTSLPFSFISSCQIHHFFVLNQYSHHVLLLCLKMHNARFLKCGLSASTARTLAFCFCSFSWWVSSLF